MASPVKVLSTTTVTDTDTTTTKDIHVTSITIPNVTPETANAIKELSEHIARSVSGEVALETARALRSQDIDRQKLEDKRSIKRNRNRMYTLFAALFISLIITFILYYPSDIGIPLSWQPRLHKFAPFSFAITIAFDSAFTVWEYIHRY